MKIKTPEYYKDFRCIAGACTDTCCAGWDVDVDDDSYQYYKKVKGAFGKRLKDVMVPSIEDGEAWGCTFTLKSGRCPFLNEENLCDLYTELGEDKLCDTCAEFPRFINEYGNVREIGLAPSCKTAGELIFGYKDKLVFEEENNDEMITSYNDIDGLLYYRLNRARQCAYELIQNRAMSIDDRCLCLLDFSSEIQKKMNREDYDGIEKITKKYSDSQWCAKRLTALKKKYESKQKAYETIPHFFDPFRGMEIINQDWLTYCEICEKFYSTMDEQQKEMSFGEAYREFDHYYADRQYEYEQLLMYYVYRYFVDAVFDGDLLLKAKIAVIGYLALKHMDVAAWNNNRKVLDKQEQVDMAHLYSRQFEHSYSNFEQYCAFFNSKRCYSFQTLMEVLNSDVWKTGNTNSIEQDGSSL